MYLVQLLLWCGVVAGPLFVATFLVEGYMRPNYNPLRKPVSVLSQGRRGWVQKANFFVSGVLLIAYAYGLYMMLGAVGAVWGPLLVFLHGAGVVGAGIFDTDYGGVRTKGFHHNRSGVLHDLFSTIVFVSLSVGCIVFANIFNMLQAPQWALYSNITGVLYLLGFIISARAFAPSSSLAPIGGLIQRLTIIIGCVWVTLSALHFLAGW
ncbi:MAG: DUF998 domain-containing protein [Patescibacteria group bacterium]